MKLKLDENFGRRCIDVLTYAGHDVATVAGQQMSGAANEDVIQACYSESRCLVTLDLRLWEPFALQARQLPWASPLSAYQAALTMRSS